MTTTAAAIEPKKKIETIANQVVCIDLTISKPGTRRKVPTEQVNRTDAENSRVHISKTVLKSESLDAVYSVVNATRAYMHSIALPLSMYRDGLYPISMSRLETAPERLEKFKEQFDAAVEKFLDDYAPEGDVESEIIKADRVALASLFETNDYPSRAEMKRKFGMDWNIHVQQTPEAMKALQPLMYAKEKKKAEARMRVAADELIAGMRGRFRDLVEHMVDKLKPNAVGDRKRFHKSNVEKLAEFLKDLGGDNILGDEVIAGLASKASKMLKGVDVEAMRDDEKYQGEVLKAFEGLKAELDEAAVEAERAFDFSQGAK